MDEVELKQSGASIVEQSQELVIFSAEDNESANSLLRAVMQGKKNIKAFWKEPKEKAHQAHKAISEREGAMLLPITMAEQRIKGKIAEYVTAERIKREAEEKKIKEANDKIERERLAAIAKAEKELEDAKETLTPAQIAAEEMKIKRQNEKEFMPEVKLEKKEAPRGQIIKTIWKAEVTDKSLVPEMYKVVDESALNKIAGALKEKASIPGVKFTKTTNVSTRL